MINCLNGGSTATSLGTWLAQLMPNFFGPGGYDLGGKPNAYVASLYQQLFKVKGQKLDAQVMAAAVAVYVTDTAEAGTVAATYGFDLTSGSAGLASWNVGTSGAALGLADNATARIFDLLLAADARTGRAGLRCRHRGLASTESRPRLGAIPLSSPEYQR